MLFILCRDLPYQVFKDIMKRNDAFESSVFINHDAAVNLVVLEPVEHFQGFSTFGDKGGLNHQLPDIRFLFRRTGGQIILHIQDPLEIVEVFAAADHPAVPGTQDCIPEGF